VSAVGHPALAPGSGRVGSGIVRHGVGQVGLALGSDAANLELPDRRASVGPVEVRVEPGTGLQDEADAGALVLRPDAGEGSIQMTSPGPKREQHCAKMVYSSVKPFCFPSQRRGILLASGANVPVSRTRRIGRR